MEWNWTNESDTFATISVNSAVRTYAYKRLLPKLKRPGILSITVEQRFWSYVDKSDPSGCWIWKKKLDRNGYGSFQVKINNKWERWRAHRFSWYLAHGEIREGLFVCHVCDNPKCIRVEHLFLGTPKDNVEDMVRKGRAPVGDRSGSVKHPETVARGEKNGEAKLSASMVLQIRELYQDGNISIAKLAKTYGVGVSQIHRIIRFLNLETHLIRLS